VDGLDEARRAAHHAERTPANLKTFRSFPNTRHSSASWNLFSFERFEEARFQLSPE